MKRYIKNAEENSKESILNDQLNQLKDDFNFLIDGIEKIGADGDFESATQLASGISESINSSINDMAQGITSEE